MAEGSSLKIERTEGEGEGEAVATEFPFLSKKMLTEMDLMDFYLALESVGATAEEKGILRGMRKRHRKSEWKRIYDQRVSAEMLKLTADLKRLGNEKNQLTEERSKLLGEIEQINSLLGVPNTDSC